MIKEFKCKSCGKAFARNEHGHKCEYCSVKCQRAEEGKSARSIFICEYCKKPFRALITKHRRFCSHKCSGSTLIDLTKIWAHIDKIQFNKLNREQNKKVTIRKCKTCGKSFEVWNCQAHRQGYYCSKKCLNSAQFTSIIKDFICEICGKPFTKIIRQSDKSPNKKCCSSKCHNIRMGTLYYTDPAYREKYLVSRSTLLKFSGTKPELKCKQILENIGISFEYQLHIKPTFIVDFCIDKTIIQIDGEYWHGHPDFEPLTLRQLAQKKRDIKQDKYLTTCGYQVFRIWANELSEDRIKSILSP